MHMTPNKHCTSASAPSSEGIGWKAALLHVGASAAWSRGLSAKALTPNTPERVHMWDTAFSNTLQQLYPLRPQTWHFCPDEMSLQIAGDRLDPRARHHHVILSPLVTFVHVVVMKHSEGLVKVKTAHCEGKHVDNVALLIRYAASDIRRLIGFMVCRERGGADGGQSEWGSINRLLAVNCLVDNFEDTRCFMMKCMICASSGWNVGALLRGIFAVCRKELASKLPGATLIFGSSWQHSSKPRNFLTWMFN